jgi:ABC-type sugar transport system substrate-binding protein
MGATVGAFAGLWACGLSVAAGKMADCFAKKKGGIVMPPSIEEFFNELADSLRPKVHELIASYTGAPLNAIQLQEISKAIEREPRKSKS